MLVEVIFESLSTDVFEPRTATGSRMLSVFGALSPSPMSWKTLVFTHLQLDVADKKSTILARQENI